MGRDAERVSSGKEVIMGNKMTPFIYPLIYSFHLLEITPIGRFACTNLLREMCILLFSQFGMSYG